MPKAAIWPFPARLLLREYWFYPIGLLVGFATIMIVEFWYWEYDGKKRERKSHEVVGPQMKRWWRFKTDTLERLAFIVAIVGFPLLLLSTCAVLYQFIEVRHIASSQNHIQLSILFFRDANTAIIDAIEINAIDGKRQILKEHGGEFGNTQLDNYLGNFDTVDQVYKEGLLTEDEMCRSFSYYVTATTKNEEVKQYMTKNPDYFDGIKELKAVVDKSKKKSCHSL